MTEYVIADPHFGHVAVIQYENRPFTSVKEMDEALVGNWNAVVTPEDRVWVLGDVSLCGAVRTRALVRRLNGEKHLVMGNHDEGRSVSFWLGCGFARVIKGLVEFDGYVLSHEPLPHPEKPNIHGHVHGQRKGLEQLHLCVSVEVTGYRPVPLNDVLRAYMGTVSRSKEETPLPLCVVVQGFRETGADLGPVNGFEEGIIVSSNAEYVERREEEIAEVVASMAGVSRGEAKMRIREAVARAASLELDGPVWMEYDGINDVLSLSCPADLGYAEASRQMSCVWDACWNHIKAWASRLSRAA